MELAIIIALLASNVWLIRRVLTKPDTVQKPPAEKPAAPVVATETAEDDIVGQSTFDINEFKDVVREAAK